MSIAKTDLPSLIRSSRALKVKSLGEVSEQLNQHLGVGAVPSSRSSLLLGQKEAKEEILYLDKDNHIIGSVAEELPCFVSQRTTLTLEPPLLPVLEQPGQEEVGGQGGEDGQGGEANQKGGQAGQGGEAGQDNKYLAGGAGPQYRKKQSKVWAFFEKSVGGDHVVCNKCGEVQRFMSNTTNMIRHIKKAHSGKGGAGTPAAWTAAGSRQLRRRAAPRSAVWQHFSRVAGEARVQCRLCREYYTYSGNTTNLRFHLKTQHPDTQCAVVEGGEGMVVGGKVTERLGDVAVEEVVEEVVEDEVEEVVTEEPEVESVDDREDGERLSVEVCGLGEEGLGAAVYVATRPASYIG